MYNRKNILRFFLIGVLTFGQVVSIVPVSAAEISLSVTELKVNNIDTPLGIDTTPYFSWINNGSGYAQSQTAYQIIVSESEKSAKEHIGDVWDSGKIESSKNYDIAYGGDTLTSKTPYYYSVRVWDENDKVSDWSDVARFETGIFDDSEWSAKWIGAVKNTIPEGEAYDLEGAKWIWRGESKNSQYPAETVWIRGGFDVNANKTVRSAYIASTYDDVGIVYVNSVYTAERVESKKSLNEVGFVDITEFIKSGHNSIVATCVNKSAGYAGFISKVYVNYTDGTTEIFVSDESYMVCSDPKSAWWSGVFDESEWVGATVIGEYGCFPWKDAPKVDASKLKFQDSAPLLRKTFEAKADVVRARAYITGLGLFELKINGELPDDTVLNPVDSQYEDTVRYRVFDVTRFIKDGKNAVTIELAGGFYDCNEYVAVDWNNAKWRDDPKACMELVIEYADGTSETVITDESWLSYNDGPTTKYTVFSGEIYDARNEIEGYSLPEFDDSSWNSVREMKAPRGKLAFQTIEPMRRVASFKPLSVERHDNGTYIVRLPEMATGWARIEFDAPAGTYITISYAERLRDDGNIKAPIGNYFLLQTDAYICKGVKGEAYEPKFSYKGYEYIQISGYDGELTIDDITCYVVATDVEYTGSFGSDSEFVNDLHEIMLRTMRNNMQGKATDTPIYEKLGWTGDFNVAMDTFNYNFDMSNFTAHFLHNLRDTGRTDGHLNEYSPSPIISGWNGPVWTQMYIRGIYKAWKVNGQFSLVEEHYSYMRKQANLYIKDIGTNWIWENNPTGLTLGDWASPYGGTSPNEGGRICNTAAIYNALTMLSEMAMALGNEAESGKYSLAASNIYKAFNEEFYDEVKGCYDTGDWKASSTRSRYRQTSNLVPLAYGLCPDEIRDQIVARLVKEIGKKDYHLDTGCVGTELLLPLLCDEGYSDVAMKILMQDTYPSWGFFLANGSTTLWEMYHEDDVRSYDHFFLGTYDEWLYSGLGGIRESTDAYETFTINPQIVDELNYVNCSIKTVRGRITSDWMRDENGHITMKIEVPVGSTASVIIPADNIARVTANQKSLFVQEGVLAATVEGNVLNVSVGSGVYTFKVGEVDPDVEAALDVDAKIDSIGDVSIESGNAIKEARASYDALSEAQKQNVSKLDVLLSAEEKYNELNGNTNTVDNVKSGCRANLLSGGLFATITSALTSAMISLKRKNTQKKR